MKTITLALGLSLAAATQLATGATYQWRDASGRMVYSDLPPPAHVRPSQIVRQPKPSSGRDAKQPSDGNGERTEQAGGSVATPPPEAAVKPAPARKTVAERQMESNKRRAAEAEAQKKQDESAAREAKTRRACDDMRASLRTLESGMRVKTVDENGVQRFVGDLERAQRVAELQRAIGEDCATR